MRLASIPLKATRVELPLWPPLLATRGPGTQSAGHAHHGMHVVLALEGELRFRVGTERSWTTAAGLLTAPDVPHALDASGKEILLVFIDPESEMGTALQPLMAAPVHGLDAKARDRLVRGADPLELMGPAGVPWTQKLLVELGGTKATDTRAIHPRVRKLLRLLRDLPSDADTSLEALAERVSLSPGRLMHTFTESLGIPLRPYLAWLRLQRAAAAIVSGMPLSEAAAAAGFADAAHMSRTFRQMLGMAPSVLQRAK